MLNQDILITDTVSNQAVEAYSMINHSIWFWICMVQFIIILVLLYKKYYQRPAFMSKAESKELKESLKNEINMHALMNNITKSGKLYKQLCKMCHPDKFANNPRQQTAEEIFKEITRSKRNFEQLILLKNRAIEELDINI